jgi:phage tail sheath protein FI
MIKRAMFLSLQWAVFEPNDIYTRQTIILAVSSFLTALWQRGGLVGNTVDEAFFVRCDQENNPQATVDQGQLIADIGVAVVRPAEFVILRIGRTQDELEVAEQVGLQV